jgi:dTDP-4-amino-4,6-dideoxygalactose transaminase
MLNNWAIKHEISIPKLPEYATNNAHMYYLICKNLEQRTALINHLKSNDIWAVFHYISLHKSPFYENKHDGRVLQETDNFTDCLLRLPLFYELDSSFVTSKILSF